MLRAVTSGADQTHSALGPVTSDLAYGLVFWGLRELVLDRALADLAPSPVQRRLPKFKWVQYGSGVLGI